MSRLWKNPLCFFVSSTMRQSILILKFKSPHNLHSCLHSSFIMKWPILFSPSFLSFYYIPNAGTYLKKRNITEEKTLQKSSYDKIEAKTLQCVMNGSCHGSNFLWPLILKLSFDEPLIYSCCVQSLPVRSFLPRETERRIFRREIVWAKSANNKGCRAL